MIEKKTNNITEEIKVRESWKQQQLNLCSEILLPIGEQVIALDDAMDATSFVFKQTKLTKEKKMKTPNRIIKFTKPNGEVLTRDFEKKEALNFLQNCPTGTRMDTYKLTDSIKTELPIVKV